VSPDSSSAGLPTLPNCDTATSLIEDRNLGEGISRMDTNEVRDYLE
jgi:hypothetical protein